MKRTKVNIVVSSASTSNQLDDRTIMLSDALMKKWKINPNSPVMLRYGAARHEVRVVPTSSAGILRLDASFASQWGLINGDSLCVQYKSNVRHLYLGPLIGVLVSRYYAGNSEKPFGTVTAFCRELTDASKLYSSSVYFITPNELGNSGDTIKGWRLTGGKWTKHTFPMPHVVYNRLTSRKLENMASVQQFFRHVKTHHNAALFNEKYLNKTEVFEALNKESSLHQYLPESHHLRNYQTLKDMCGKYRVVFLKPASGSLGKGIIRITRTSAQSYICHITNVNGARKQTFANLSQLFSAFAGKFKQRRYQIQQGVNLISVDGHPVDFRAVVQRNELGQWVVTSTVARIAGNHHFVSNLARGGSLSTVKEALARSNSPTGTNGSMKLRKAALAIAKGIETSIPAHFAELGIDLAMDTQGNVWLLEVNSKPSKEDNAALSDEIKIRPSVKRVIQYSRYAAKF